MIRRTAYKKYLWLALFLFAVMSFPLVFTEKIRSLTIATFSPLWKMASRANNSTSKVQTLQNDCRRLESENQLLRSEIFKLKALLEQQSVSEKLQKELGLYTSKDQKRRYEESGFLLTTFSYAIPAQVIYRDPANWASSLWIGIGEDTNTVLGKKIIQKNSPVVVGKAVVGAIDYVGKKQARVRLVTDFGLKPSVRTLRGYPQSILIAEHADAILRRLNGRNEILLSPEETTTLTSLLQALKGRTLDKSEGWYLAKGIIQGSGAPLWRSSGNKLHGMGFNYDFSDEEGPARDLLTGQSLDPALPFLPMPLVKVNDLLVTTGMDGVFPAGLYVGEVTKVYPLREGGYTYEIEAIPILGHLDELQTLFVLPPLGFDTNDQPL